MSCREAATFYITDTKITVTCYPFIYFSVVSVVLWFALALESGLQLTENYKTVLIHTNSEFFLLDKQLMSEHIQI